MAMSLLNKKCAKKEKLLFREITDDGWGDVGNWASVLDSQNSMSSSCEKRDRKKRKIIKDYTHLAQTKIELTTAQNTNKKNVKNRLLQNIEMAQLSLKTWL